MENNTARDPTHLEIAQRILASGDVTPERIAAALDGCERSARRSEREKCSDVIGDYSLTIHEENVAKSRLAKYLPDLQSQIEVAGALREHLSYAGVLITRQDYERRALPLEPST